MTDAPAPSRGPSRGTLSLSRPLPPSVQARVARIAGQAAAVPTPPPPAEPEPARPLTKRQAKAAAAAERAAAKAARLAIKPAMLKAARARVKAKEAAEREQVAARRVADLALCREKFPRLFDIEHPVPLAIHIHKQLGKVIGSKRAKHLLDWWAAWQSYTAAVAAGGSRYNLDGSIAGEVSEAHREFARAALSCNPQAVEQAA